MERRLRICQHCDSEFTVASTGRPPTYCTATCRKNAWHQRKVDEAVRAAQEKAEEATAAAIARAVLAERRRSNRGNETPPTTGNRGNETPAAGQRRGRWVPSGLSMAPLWVDEDEPQPDAQPKTDPR